MTETDGTQIRRSLLLEDPGNEAGRCELDVARRWAACWRTRCGVKMGCLLVRTFTDTHTGKHTIDGGRNTDRQRMGRTGVFIVPRRTLGCAASVPGLTCEGGESDSRGADLEEQSKVEWTWLTRGRFRGVEQGRMKVTHEGEIWGSRARGNEHDSWWEKWHVRGEVSLVV